MPFVTSTKGFPEMKFICSLPLTPGSMHSVSHDHRDLGSGEKVQNKIFVEIFTLVGCLHKLVVGY